MDILEETPPSNIREGIENIKHNLVKASNSKLIGLVTSSVMSVCMLSMTNDSFNPAPKNNPDTSTESKTPTALPTLIPTSLTLMSVVRAINLAATVASISKACISCIKTPKHASPFTYRQVMTSSLTFTAAGLTGLSSTLTSLSTRISSQIDPSTNSTTASYISSQTMSSVSSILYLSSVGLHVANLVSSDPNQTGRRGRSLSIPALEEILLASVSLEEPLSIIVHALSEENSNELNSEDNTE
ncbi:hypothetical protein CLAVI_000525 [Candidatus Clavichlamydia salmonicola]|nr:hypothetical protein [Candidatus Clavichlamydia salmonicola]